MKYIEVPRVKGIEKYENMINRCYCDSVHRYKPCYIGHTVCPEWLNGPNDTCGRDQFLEWLNDGQFYVIDGERTVELDHNILVKGNTVYSPEACVFAPSPINAMFGKYAGQRAAEGLPLGVAPTENGMYRACVKGCRDLFSTPEEAFEVWAERQHANIISKAEEYYGRIPTRLFDAMVNWRFEITD